MPDMNSTYLLGTAKQEMQSIAGAVLLPDADAEEPWRRVRGGRRTYTRMRNIKII
jgi:hypothetical protein